MALWKEKNQKLTVLAILDLDLMVIVYGQIPKKIQDKRNALNNLTQYNKDGVFSNEINCLKREINILLDDEELY